VNVLATIHHGGHWQNLNQLSSLISFIVNGVLIPLPTSYLCWLATCSVWLGKYVVICNSCSSSEWTV